VAEDPFGRTNEVRDLITFAIARESLADAINEEKFPVRIVHNDTKLNNVLLDKKTGEGICVVDLDTVMPGCALHDFGDLVRTAACSAQEDEPDVNRIQFLPEIFEALVEGYLDATNCFLSPLEVDHLAIAPQVLTYELALRFLADYLEGDIYFKVKRPGHNLQRARAQFRLLASMEEHASEMESIVEKFATAVK
jgi:Ser/Thr protein kinase RdoA (MazF antagonist)